MWGATQSEREDLFLTLFGFKGWLCWPIISSLWEKCGRPVLGYYFGLCAVFPLSLLLGGMMLEEQLSFPCDFLFFKTYFKAWKNGQSFLLKKIQVLHSNYEYSQKKIHLNVTNTSVLLKISFPSVFLTNRRQLQPITPCASAFVN